VLEDQLFLLIHFENYWVFIVPDSLTTHTKSFLTISGYLFGHGIGLFLFSFTPLQKQWCPTAGFAKASKAN
jgi:hypothetical protein